MFRLLVTSTLLVLVALSPLKARSQTRLFQPGDSGAVTTLDFLLISEDYNQDSFGVLRGSYTHKGFWDLGLEYGDTDLHSGSRRQTAFFTNLAAINPAPGDHFGLEAGLRYSENTADRQLPAVPGYFIPDYDRVRHRNIIPGVRGFFRGTQANQVLGLGVHYRFRKYEVLATDDEVLLGYDYEELGFDLDFHGRIWGIMHLSMTIDYTQFTTPTEERWELATVWSIGVLFGRKSEEGKPSDE